MDKITSSMNTTHRNHSALTSREKERDIRGFDIALKTLLSDKNKEDDDGADSSAVDYIVPFEQMKKEYILERKSKDKIEYQSMQGVEVNSANITINRNDTGQYQPCGQTIHNIDELSRIFNNILTLTNGASKRQWQFTYIDSSLGRFNMTVKKESQQNISLIITTPQMVKANCRKLTSQLYCRLLKKGWESQISLTSEEGTHRKIAYEKE